MSISIKCRKLLWGRSGNRCAMCRQELIMEASSKDDESVVGDECHIISNSKNGPRYEPGFDSKFIDEYSNLILLCKVHHKLIDDQESTYTSHVLSEIKDNHEKWVNDKLNSETDKENPIRIKRLAKNIPDFLIRITTGKELLDVVLNSYGFSFDHDELQTEEEAELVASFLQNAQDWGNIGLDDSGERVTVGFQLNDSIKKLKQAGFWVFGGREVRLLEGGNAPNSDFPVAILRVVSISNDEIVKFPYNKGDV